MVVVEGEQPGGKIGKLALERATICCLKRKLEVSNQRLATAEVALDLMSKMHELLENLSQSSWGEPPRSRQ